MRFLANINDPSQAMGLHALLLQEGVENRCERGKKGYEIWVIDEDQYEKAVAVFEAHTKNPTSAPPPPPAPEKQPDIPIPQVTPKRIRTAAPVTKLFILLCAAVFIVVLFQQNRLRKEHPSYARNMRYTELQIAFLYDVPTVFEKLRTFFYNHPKASLDKEDNLSVQERLELQKIDRTPHWIGLYNHFVSPRRELTGPLCEKIAEGEVWRLFTPVLLHGGFLHLLFNMLWFWLLGRFVEYNVRAVRYLALILVIGIVSNTCQYFMSGPSFMGFSGVVSGLAGFIWIRQRNAPWEHYPLPRATLLFLAVFIVGMALFQVLAFFLQKYEITTLAIGVANTAHVTGALTGILLAKLPTFEAR